MGLAEVAPAEAREERVEGVDGAGHGDGQPAALGKGRVAAAAEVLEGGGSRGAPAPVVAVERLRVLVPDEREDVPAEAGAHRVDHAEHGGGGDGGVHGGAPGAQGLEPGLDGERVAADHHPLRRQPVGSVDGVHGIGHTAHGGGPSG